MRRKPPYVAPRRHGRLSGRFEVGPDSERTTAQVGHRPGPVLPLLLKPVIRPAAPTTLLPLVNAQPQSINRPLHSQARRPTAYYIEATRRQYGPPTHTTLDLSPAASQCRLRAPFAGEYFHKVYRRRCISVV